MQPVTAYAQINARIMPSDRGSRFETPLEEELEKSGLGLVHGGGTMQLKTGELEYCGIDLELFDLDRGAAFACEFLERRGAPKGSKLTYESNGVRHEIPFGRVEGLALYLNGTDLPDKVYQECDSTVVIDTLNQLLGDVGGIWNYWQGPTETALYLYGKSSEEMSRRISGFLASYPLCQRARLVKIA